MTLGARAPSSKRGYNKTAIASSSTSKRRRWGWTEHDAAGFHFSTINTILYNMMLMLVPYVWVFVLFFFSHTVDIFFFKRKKSGENCIKPDHKRLTVC